jgi:hypothetical protein
MRACNPSAQEAEAGNCEFQASPGYLVTAYLKKHHFQKLCSPCLFFHFLVILGVGLNSGLALLESHLQPF